MRKFEIEVEKVTGRCSYSYGEGDKFIFDGYSTPEGFCGGAYTTSGETSGDYGSVVGHAGLIVS